MQTLITHLYTTMCRFGCIEFAPFCIERMLERLRSAGMLSCFGKPC